MKNANPDNPMTPTLHESSTSQPKNCRLKKSQWTFVSSIAAAALILCAADSRANNLLAGWTFNDQTTQTQALTADLGTLAGQASFVNGGYGGSQVLTLNKDGTITLGTGEFLYSSAINSNTYANLLSGVTVVAWVTLQGVSNAGSNLALYGLVNGAPAASGAIFMNSQGALGYSERYGNSLAATPDVHVVGVGSDETTQFTGSVTGANTITIGAETQTAIGFSTTGAKCTYFDSTAGSMKSGSKTTTLTLGAFSGLAIGRLNQGGADYSKGLIVNEIDVYEGALTQDQISALTAAAVPEPSTWAEVLLGGVGMLMAGRKLRRPYLES